MKLLGLDLETTGLDKKNDKLLEVAMVVWDTEIAAPINFYNFLFEQEVPEIITNITGITQEMSSKYGQAGYYSLVDTLSYLLSVGGFDAIVAHNAHRFDIPFLTHQLLNYGEEDLAKAISDSPTIDTRYDLPVAHLLSGKKRTLDALSEVHDLDNPFPHRALTDTLLTLLVAQKYDLQKIIDEVLPSPLVYITYFTKFPGAYWWPEEKLFRMAVRDCYYEDEKASLLAMDIPISPLKIKKMDIPEGED